MIPVALLWGFLLGKWWRLVVPLAGAAWAVLLVADGVIRPVDRTVLGAALAGALNAAVGAAVNRGLAALVASVGRRFRAR